MPAFCIIQNRSTSTRYPGKCFEYLAGTTITKRVFDTCRSVYSYLIFAIPKGDTKLVEYLEENYMPYFAGEPDDVLRRYYDCAETYHADPVIRITADCPVLDPMSLSMALQVQQATHFDFVSNCPPVGRTSPDGWDVEVMSFRCLKWLNETATKPEHREHVTKYIYDNLQRFDAMGYKRIFLNFPIDLSHIKCSVDTPEDLKRIEGMMTKC